MGGKSIVVPKGVPTSDIDLWSTELLDNPYPVYKVLRDAGSAVWLNHHQVWAVTRYSSVREALLNTDAFTSTAGVSMNSAINQASKGVMLTTDDPEHRRLRRVFSRPLTPAAVSALRGRLAALAEVRLSELLERGEFDAVTQLAPFSSSVPTLQAALKHIVPGDGTAIYDAVYLGSEALARNPSGRRRVIVLVTDAGETTSRADFETARRAALRADALLYTIVVRVVKNESGRNTAGEHALETIADSTGGATYFPDTAGELGEMFDRIDRELRTQYRLGYYPNPRPPDGAYRALEVRVHCECKIRSRKAYYTGGHLD